MEREKGWNLLCKFFDNMGPIPHHMHQRDEHAQKVGRRGKPEAYYFPPQYNPTDNNFPYTFMGLEPGTTKDEVRRCLENWNKGDNGITVLVAGVSSGARQRLADRSRHPACAGFAADLRAAGEQRRVRDVPVGGRRPHHAVGAARERRPARPAAGSRLHHRHARLGRERESAVRREQPLLAEAGEAVRRDGTRRIPRAVGELRDALGTPQRS